MVARTSQRLREVGDEIEDMGYARPLILAADVTGRSFPNAVRERVPVAYGELTLSSTTQASPTHGHDPQ